MDLSKQAPYLSAQNKRKKRPLINQINNVNREDRVFRVPQPALYLSPSIINPKQCNFQFLQENSFWKILSIAIYHSL